MLFSLLAPARRKDQAAVDQDATDGVREQARDAIKRARHHLDVKERELRALMESPPGAWFDCQLDTQERKGW